MGATRGLGFCRCVQNDKEKDLVRPDGGKRHFVVSSPGSLRLVMPRASLCFCSW